MQEKLDEEMCGKFLNIKTDWKPQKERSILTQTLNGWKNHTKLNEQVIKEQYVIIFK